MASIRLHGVSVDFPIYNTNARSLKKRILHTGTGGRIGSDPRNSTLCVRALDDVNLQMRHGERIGLVGVNGSGKTTLLRVLAGVYEPTSGHIQREGHVSSLFDLSLGIDPDTSGYDNIKTRGRLLGLGSDEIEERIEEIADFTGLGGYLELPVSTYSAGMTMRLAFAVSVCVNHEILLMDEWIGAADASFMKKAEKHLEDLISRAGILVFASHATGQIKSICTQAILMHAGRLEMYGPVEEVLRHYEKRLEKAS